MKSRKTHLINNKGEKLVVETREFNMDHPTFRVIKSI